MGDFFINSDTDGNTTTYTEDDYLQGILLASGDCENNVTWELDTDGTLTISGSGEMADYQDSYDDSPWHTYKNQIKKVIIADGVTSIGRNAFKSCESLNSITIPDSVTSIRYAAFNGCTNLDFITIPNNVTSISNCTFLNCHSLTSITIPNGVTSIGANAFDSCTSLTSIDISDSVTNIGKYAFWNCNSLEDVDFKGTKAQWNSISIGEGNDHLTGANIHCATN